MLFLETRHLIIPDAMEEAIMSDNAHLYRYDVIRRKCGFITCLCGCLAVEASDGCFCFFGPSLDLFVNGKQNSLLFLSCIIVWAEA